MLFAIGYEKKKFSFSLNYYFVCEKKTSIEDINGKNFFCWKMGPKILYFSDQATSTAVINSINSYKLLKIRECHFFFI